MFRPDVFCFVIIVLSLTNLHAQPQNLWTRVYGTRTFEQPVKCLPLSNGDYVISSICNYRYHLEGDGNSLQLHYLDQNFNPQWTQTVRYRAESNYFSSNHWLFETADEELVLLAESGGENWLTRWSFQGDSLAGRCLSRSDVYIREAISTPDGNLALLANKALWLINFEGDSLFATDLLPMVTGDAYVRGLACADDGSFYISYRIRFGSLGNEIITVDPEGAIVDWTSGVRSSELLSATDNSLLSFGTSTIQKFDQRLNEEWSVRLGAMSGILMNSEIGYTYIYSHNFDNDQHDNLSICVFDRTGNILTNLIHQNLKFTVQDAEALADGDLLLIGYSFSDDQWDEDAVYFDLSPDLEIMKLDSQGDILQHRVIGLPGPDEEVAALMAVNSDDEIFITSTTPVLNEAGKYQRGLLLMKLAPAGDSLAAQTFCFENHNFSEDLITTRDGGCLVSISSHLRDPRWSHWNEIEATVVKVDVNLNSEWTLTFDQSLRNLVSGLVELPSEEYFVTGYQVDQADSLHWQYRGFLLKVTSDGEILLERHYPDQALMTIRELEEDRFTIIRRNYFHPDSASRDDFFVINERGETILAAEDSYEARLTDVMSAHDQGFVVIGKYRSYPALYLTDDLGNLLSEHIGWGLAYRTFTRIYSDPNNFYLVTDNLGGLHFINEEGVRDRFFDYAEHNGARYGTFADLALSPAEPPSDFIYLLGTTNEDLILTKADLLRWDPPRIGDAVAPSGKIPESCQVLSAYPNPFNSSTTVSWRLTEPASLSLLIFDTRGQQIAELTQPQVSAGDYVIHLNAADWAAGVYLARLQVGSQIRTMKLVCVK